MQHYVGINCEEFLVGEALEKRGWQVYVPTKDVGIDLLAERDDRTIRVQVKGSRTYITISDSIPWCSWTQLRPDALRRATEMGVEPVRIRRLRAGRQRASSPNRAVLRDNQPS